MVLESSLSSTGDHERCKTGAKSFIFRLFRQVIRAARIRYDRQVVFGLPHHLRMRSSPKLHVLKPWLNRFIFACVGPCSGDSDVKWVKVRGARWSRCDPTLVRTKLSLLYIYSVPEPLGTLYGDTAVNTGYYTFSFTKDGETKSLPARYSLTYVKEGNDCKIVDHHSSAMPTPPK